MSCGKNTITREKADTTSVMEEKRRPNGRYADFALFAFGHKYPIK